VAPAGDTVFLVVDIQNNSTSDFEIKDTKESCSCVSVQTTSTKIKKGDSISLLAKIKLPSQTKQTKFQGLIEIRGESKDFSIPIVFEFLLSGLCCFQSSEIFLKVPAEVKSQQIELPVLLSKPYNLNDIKIVGTGDFANCSGKFHERENGHVYLVKKEVPDKEAFTMSGEFQLVGGKQSAIDRIVCVIARERSVRVYPSTLHFARDKGVFRATALVRVDSKFASDKSASSQVSITASAGQTPAVLVVREIATGTFRIDISLGDSNRNEPNEQLNNESALGRIESVDWRIEWRGEVHEVKSKVFFARE
jgi:hypothetical protein